MPPLEDGEAAPPVAGAVVAALAAAGALAAPAGDSSGEEQDFSAAPVEHAIPDVEGALPVFPDVAPVAHLDPDAVPLPAAEGNSSESEAMDIAPPADSPAHGETTSICGFPCRTERHVRGWLGIRMDCPNEAHKCVGCGKYRSLRKFAKELGPNAAELALETWVSRAWDDDLSPMAHKNWVPTLAQVRQYQRGEKVA